MNNNPLFASTETPWLKELSEDFKERTLYYNLGINLTQTLKKVKNNTEFRTFLQSKAKHKNFKQILQFYTKYISDALFTKATQDFIDKFVSENIQKIVLQGYVEKSNFENFIEKGDFEQHSDKDIQKVVSSMYPWEKEEALESIEKYKKLQTDFDFLKKEIFLDYGSQSNKIIVSIEWLFAWFKMYNGEFLSNENQIFYLIFQDVGGMFTKVNSENAKIIKIFSAIAQDHFGEKYNKTQMFYFLVYNKIIENANEDILEDSVKKFQSLLDQGYIKRKVGSMFEILSEEICSTQEYLYLRKHNILFISDERCQEAVVTQDFHSEFYKDQKVKQIKTFSKIELSEVISREVCDNKRYSKHIKVVEIFFNTENIIKRNIAIKKKDINTYRDVYKHCKSGIGSFLQNFLHQEDGDYLFYEVLLQPLEQASRKLITANFYNTADFALSSDFEKVFTDFLTKYKNKYIEIDDFIDAFFEKSMETYILFQRIRSYLEGELHNKVTDPEMSRYLFSEKQLFKRVLEYLAQIGYIDIAGETITKKISYNSGSGGYGWGSYGLYERDENINIFESKYIKFKDVKIKYDFEEKSYISGQEIYLSLITSQENIEKFSKFSVLKQLENYIVLDINRDSLIKAKNTYNISAEDIKDVFKTISLDIPSNIEILLNSVDNQKPDITLLPQGIPIFVENMGMFQEFKKLKMFSKYIIFSDEEKKLIIFSSDFRGLEKLLNKRKVLFKSVKI